MVYALKVNNNKIKGQGSIWNEMDHMEGRFQEQDLFFHTAKCKVIHLKIRT